ncbi:MAG: hypothetical protein ABI640_12910 [Gammaproteobacteria bacterium]
MAIPWAPDLPQKFLRAGYQIEPIDNVIRESMEVGPPKIRRRSTVQVNKINAAMSMTNEQRRSFESFYRVVLFEGTIAFALDDPDGITREFFIIAPPVIQPEGRGWRVDLQLQYTAV